MAPFFGAWFSCRAIALREGRWSFSGRLELRRTVIQCDPLGFLIEFGRTRPDAVGRVLDRLVAQSGPAAAGLCRRLVVGSLEIVDDSRS